MSMTFQRDEKTLAPNCANLAHVGASRRNVAQLGASWRNVAQASAKGAICATQTTMVIRQCCFFIH